jgi:putative Ca2+/H+ antiporter (TMEM165/GDT1 family)
LLGVAGALLTNALSCGDDSPWYVCFGKTMAFVVAGIPAATAGILLAAGTVLPSRRLRLAVIAAVVGAFLAIITAFIFLILD